MFAIRSSNRPKEPKNGLALKDIYAHALNTRNMEIDLFWKRCNYFLVLNSGLAVAYFNVAQEGLQIPAAILGVIVSVLWLQVALGSKFWQQRWEDCLHSVEVDLINERKFANGRALFSLEPADAQNLIENSLEESGHSGVYHLLDAYIVSKPSVTLAMMYLVITFLASWVLLLGYRFFTLIALPAAGY